MKRNGYTCCLQKKAFPWKQCLLMLLYPLSSYSDFSGASCSYNPVTGCVLEAKLNALLAEVQTVQGDPIFIFANIHSDLRPQTETGPTDYVGDGKVVLTLTNNSLHYINVNCSGTIYMKGSRGSTITTAIPSLITQQSFNISASNIPSGSGPAVLTKDVTNFSSSGMNLWQASLGTQPQEPLDCQITFIMPTQSTNPTIHVYVPIAYS